MSGSEARRARAVFVVCHPDDEALWVGGIICELSRFEWLDTYVICLSGKDSTSPREAEFQAARKIAGYKGGVVLGFPLRPANTPLPPIGPTIAEGLTALGLDARDVDFMATHPGYGDEHMNPHHVQSHRETREWARNHRIPFGFFSCMPIPYFKLTPTANHFRRLGTLHLVNRSRCEFANSLAWRVAMGVGALAECPAEFLQFITDGTRKREMLECYQSVDIAAHEAGYASFTSNCESLYIVDEAAAPFVNRLVDSMPSPTEEPLFRTQPLTARIAEKARRLITH